MPRSKKLTTQTCPVPPQPVRQELLAILGAAPAPVRRAMADLLSSIKAGLAAAGETPQFADARAKVFDWRTLLPMLTDIRCKLDTPVAARLRRRGKAKAELARLEGQFALLRRAHEQMSLMVQITYALVNVGGEFQTPEEILEQSAGVLMEQLEADLFVCRLRDKSEEWVNVAADTAHGTQTPIFVHALEESIPGHPVMQAVASKPWSYVLSNNLMSAERGGDSYDCVAFQEGYRS
ncbi:MAG: histidine kinase, partial [Desulfovibrio sp.]|nr:histidine kinase [Desulfovibrio sp.]